MEKLILKRDEEDYYKLEINDNGDYIEIDTTDISWVERLMEGTQKALENDIQYAKEVNEILENKELTNLDKAKILFKKEKQYFETMNMLFNSFLGKGSCDKIFQGKRSYGQYKKLLDALEPHFKNIVIQKSKAKSKLAQRFLFKNSDTL